MLEHYEGGIWAIAATLALHLEYTLASLTLAKHVIIKLAGDDLSSTYLVVYQAVRSFRDVSDEGQKNPDLPELTACSATPIPSMLHLYPAASA